MRLQSYPIPNTEQLSIVWSAVPVIKCFKKGQNVNILNILHVIRIRFRTVLVDSHVPETVPTCYTKRVRCKKCHPSWYDLNETFLRVVLVFVLSARSRAVSSQLCLHETINYSVGNCFINIKMKIIILNVETNFRHDQSLSCVRLWQASAIPYTIISSTSCYLLMSASQWLCKHILIGDYFPNPDKRGSHYYLMCYDKAAYTISQAWLWSYS